MKLLFYLTLLTTIFATMTDAFGSPKYRPSMSFLRTSLSTRRYYFDDITRSNTLDFTPEGEWRSFLTNRTYAEEKAFVMEALLTGYDATTAASLTDEHVKDQIHCWADRSGLVGNTYGDEIYDSILSTSICRSETMIGCLAQYWETLVNVIHNTTEPSPTGVSLLVFTNCESLYTYKRMAMLNAAMELSQGLCTYLGSKLTLSLFHPTYKNAPRMLSPARHSPFPMVGLQFKTVRQEDVIHQSPYEYHGETIADDYISNIHERRRMLELLFQSAAADTPIVFTDEFLSKETVQEQMTQWITTDLQYNGDRWTVTNSTMGEELFASIWHVIHELSRLGKDADHVAWERAQYIPVDPLAWNNIISNAQVLTSMFVAPKFHTYHAQSFKRFATTVNAILKQLTGGIIFLELFHPEYVGATEGESRLRRAPFPAIQICYQVQPKRKVVE